MTLDTIYQSLVNTLVRLLNPHRLREALDQRLASDVAAQLSSSAVESRMREIERYLASVGDVFDLDEDDDADLLADLDAADGDSDDGSEADEAILEADCAIYALLQENNWREWKEDERRGIHQPPREKSVYDLYDAYLSSQLQQQQRPPQTPGAGQGQPSSPAVARREPRGESVGALGMYKFTEDGECITVAGGKWHAVAYELEAMYRKADDCPWDR